MILKRTGKFHESIIHAVILIIKTLCQVDFPILHIKLGTSFEIFPNLASQNKIQRQGWDKHCKNRAGTKMGEKECKPFRIRSRTCKYWQ